MTLGDFISKLTSVDPNEIIGSGLCHGPRSLHVANILAFEPKLGHPYKLFRFDFLNEFMCLVITPSQKYYGPDLTYIRGKVAESYSKQVISLS